MVQRGGLVAARVEDSCLAARRDGLLSRGYCCVLRLRLRDSGCGDVGPEEAGQLGAHHIDRRGMGRPGVNIEHDSVRHRLLAWAFPKLCLGFA